MFFFSYRRPDPAILNGRNKMEAKALIMSRFAMLDCANNYETKYKGKNCQICKCLDDECHRINDCMKFKDVNMFDKSERVDFGKVFESDPETLTSIARTVLSIWDIENGRNTMKLLTEEPSLTHD